MPHFNVSIWGKGLERARQPLHDAGIKTVGPDWLSGVLGVFRRRGRGMTALLDADTALEAEDRVRDALPDDDYTVGQAKHRHRR
jgi:hypothetical protein